MDRRHPRLTASLAFTRSLPLGPLRSTSIHNILINSPATQAERRGEQVYVGVGARRHVQKSCSTRGHQKVLGLVHNTADSSFNPQPSIMGYESLNRSDSICARTATTGKHQPYC